MTNNCRERKRIRFSRLYELKCSFLQHGKMGTAAACVWAATSIPTPSVAAPVTVSGTVNARITVTFVTAPLAGSTVSCGVALISNDVYAPNDSKSVTVPVSGSTAVCSIPIRYKWRLSSSSSTMTIAYSVSGPAQASSAIHSTIPVPPNGTTTAAIVAVTQ